MTALVMNCDYNGLGVIQALGPFGIPLYALDRKRSVGTFSRYATYWQCPDPMTSEERFIEFLVSRGSQFSEKPVLLPTNDEWAMALSRNKLELQASYVPCVADWAVVDLVIDKSKFCKWGAEIGYPVPRIWHIREADGIPSDSFPLAAKPKHRRVAGDDARARALSVVLERYRLTILRDRGQLDEFLTQHERILPHMLLQEYVEGLSDRMYTVGVYANQRHEVVGLFTGRKVRGFPPDCGDCIVGQSEPVPAYIKEMVKDICGRLGYQGIAEFEFKRDAKTEALKIIEINPRSWSWIGITPACNVNLPWIAYTDLMGRGGVGCRESTKGEGEVKWAKPIDDLKNCLYRNKRAGFPEWHMGIRQWWRTLAGSRLVLAGLNPRDPLPLLYTLSPKLFRKIHRFFTALAKGLRQSGS